MKYQREAPQIAQHVVHVESSTVKFIVPPPLQTNLLGPIPKVTL